MVLALERWVEDGTAPDALIADRAGQPARSRPVCPYPQMAQYKGTGSVDDAANFACGVPGAKARD
jgi:feruloyl esterase